MRIRSPMRRLLVTVIALALFMGGVALQGKGSMGPHPSGLLETLTVQAAEIRVTTANLNMRTGPGTGYAIIMTVPKGAEVLVDSYSGSWAKGTYGGKTGYLSTAYLAAPTSVVRYTTEALNLRTGPGTGYAVILTIPKGSRVEMLSSSGGWAKVTYGSTTGYASTSYLTSTPPGTSTGTVRYATANVNMRTGPGTGYAIILTIPKGAQVEVLSSASGWSRVNYSGRTGYASSTYLSSTPPGTTSPSTGSAARVVNKGLIPYSGKRIALTFDDGGSTSQVLSILNTLDRYGVKSTFFLNGTWIRNNPSLARDIVGRGHRLENHSLSHPDLSKATESEIRRQIREANATIRSTVGTTSTLLRPPYGAYDSRVLRIAGEEGMKYAVLWSVDTSDWATTRYGVTITVSYIVNHTLQNATNNGIVLMHLHSDKTVEALPRMIQGLRDMGYSFATVNEMLP